MFIDLQPLWGFFILCVSSFVLKENNVISLQLNIIMVQYIRKLSNNIFVQGF